jgi:hypothetical protein
MRLCFFCLLFACFALVVKSSVFGVSLMEDFYTKNLNFLFWGRWVVLGVELRACAC